MSSTKETSQERPQHKRRIDMDVLRLLEAGYEVNTDSGLDKLIVKLAGPKETLYEKGVWKIRVEITARYPFEPPNVRFCNKIFHPNIDEATGKVCLDVLSQRWSAMFDLKNIFDTFLPQLLTYPNPKDPLNNDAGVIMDNQYERFVELVNEYIERFATEEALKKPLNSGVWSCRPDFQPGDDVLMDLNIREIVRQHQPAAPTTPPTEFQSAGQPRTPSGSPPPDEALDDEPMDLADDDATENEDTSNVMEEDDHGAIANQDVVDDKGENEDKGDEIGDKVEIDNKSKIVNKDKIDDEYSSESSMSDPNFTDEEEEDKK